MTSIHVVVMGVAGCGKSAIGNALARELALPLIEGDEFHPPSNIEKMKRGEPLDDDDRAGWLERLAQELRRRPNGAVLACSALKRSYRDTLRTGSPNLHFVHLALTMDESLKRVASRTDHFYPPSLVASQFAALEDPSAEPGVLVADATLPVETIARQAGDWLRSQFNNP